jgi:hypothetical protein
MGENWHHQPKWMVNKDNIKTTNIYGSITRRQFSWIALYAEAMFARLP